MFEREARYKNVGGEILFGLYYQFGLKKFLEKQMIGILCGLVHYQKKAILQYINEFVNY